MTKYSTTDVALLKRWNARGVHPDDIDRLVDAGFLTFCENDSRSVTIDVILTTIGRKVLGERKKTLKKNPIRKTECEVCGHIANKETHPCGDMSNPRKGRARRNPALVTFGNPRSGELMSKDVCEIRYQHIEDGQYYKHEFRKRQVELVASANPHYAILRRVDGNPLIGDY